jgi:uncharacterized membrane protein
VQWIRDQTQECVTMRFSPILLSHISAGTLGLLSGAVAMFFRKGSHRHALAGKVFVISMLSMAASGAYMAFMKSQPGNVVGGTFTFYLVATAWMTARRGDGKTTTLDWGALLVALAVAAVDMTFGLQATNSPTGMKHGYPPGPYFFMGSVAVLASVGDVRMLVRGGISGTQRIARHLWRMCFGLFIASASVFLARQHLFPAFLRTTGVLFFLSILPLLLMIFWLLRVRITNAFKGPSIPSGRDVQSARAWASKSPLRVERPAVDAIAR